MTNTCILHNIILLFKGEKEHEEGMLHSILAQMEYSYQICKWHDAVIPFHMYMYVPGKHPVTGSDVHEREDFAHVLKVHTCFLIYFML